MSEQVAVAPSKQINLLKVLGPVHVWALGVGIVLVGEFMGWNYGVGKGGAFGALISCFVIGLLYTCVAMIDSEITSTVAAAGGQYAQAKHTIGPLMAFNVGLYLVLAYTMLEAGDIQVAGQLLQIGAAELGHDIPWEPFTILTLAILAWLNYRGVFMTLTVNFVITAAAFLSIIILLIGVQPWNTGAGAVICPMAGSACWPRCISASGTIWASRAPARRRRKCARPAARFPSAP
jgi:ethanolamine permease